MTRSPNSAFKIECHAIELHRDGNWTPLYYQTDKNSHIISEMNTKKRGNILASLSEQSEKQF